MQTESEYLANECAKILATLPDYPSIERGNFKISKGFAKKGISDNFWYNPRTARISYFATPFDMEYPALHQFIGNKWVVWMSGSPLECLSMKSHAQRASGHMLIGGLGLGILAWLCAAKPLVKSVTVVELQKEVIDLVGPVVGHPKIHIIQGDVRQHIQDTKSKYDFISLDIWPGIGRAALEAFDAKRYASQSLNRGGVVRTWLDEIADRLSKTNAIDNAVQQARTTRGKMLDQPQMVGNRACELCGAKPFIDCYGFCMECFIQTGICQASGQGIIDKMRRLWDRGMRGELNHLAEPYPELYAHIQNTYPRNEDGKSN